MQPTIRRTITFTITETWTITWQDGAETVWQAPPKAVDLAVQATSHPLATTAAAEWKPAPTSSSPSSTKKTRRQRLPRGSVGRT